MNLKIIKKIKTDFILQKIKSLITDQEVYLVGGTLRDFYLNFENHDKDLAVKAADVKGFAKKIADAFNATFVPLDEENKIYRIVLENKIDFIDVAQIVGSSIEDDLTRRDLTINAIAFDLKTEKIIDSVGGVDDLKNKKIKHILEENYIDDPLRLLRVFRFSSTLGFEIDDDVLKTIKKHANLIQNPAKERIAYELLKLFSGDNTANTIVYMNKSGILDFIFPFVKELKKVPPNLHHHLNLFMHSIEVVKQIQIIYEKSDERIKNHLENIDFGGFSRLAHLKFAGFLHDIGKFSTWTIEQDSGRHRFIKHDDVGAKMSSSLLKKFKLSKKQVEYVSKMVKNHIYPSHVVQAPEISDKIYLRMIRKMEEDTIDVIILAMADRLSARGPEITDEIVNNNIEALSKLLNFYLDEKEKFKPLPKLLSGGEIMHILNISPSPILGKIIKQLQELQQNGEIETKEQALEFIKSLEYSILDI